MRIFVIVVVIMCASLQTRAQYWFGPKVGVNRSNFLYQDEDYSQDSVKVGPSNNFEVGGVVIYQATDLFSVHGEIYYEQIKKTLTSKPDAPYNAASKVTNRFISTPMMFRITIGKQPPIHYYVDGGIKMRFWMGGKGRIVGGESEFGEGKLTYDKVVFKQSNSDLDHGVIAAPQGNIMQFGLVAGGGIYIDLISGGRLMVDFRYSFGHSNMGFDGNKDFGVGNAGYREKLSYRNNTISLSLAYLFEFDQQLQRKGKSTSSVSKSNNGHKVKKK